MNLPSIVNQLSRSRAKSRAFMLKLTGTQTFLGMLLINSSFEMSSIVILAINALILATQIVGFSRPTNVFDEDRSTLKIYQNNNK